MQDNRKLEFWVNTPLKRDDVEGKSVRFDIIAAGNRCHGSGWFVYQDRLDEHDKVYIQLRFETDALPGDNPGKHIEIHGLPQEAVDCIRTSTTSLYDLDLLYPHELRP